MARVIDITKLSEKYEPLQLTLPDGTVCTCNAFDQNVVKALTEAPKSVQSDSAKTSHDVYAAQVAAAFHLDPEDLTGIDLRVLRDVVAEIMEAVLGSGESQPKSEQPAK